MHLDLEDLVGLEEHQGIQELQDQLVLMESQELQGQLDH